MGVSSSSYFFARINRIGSVVELKFYIRIQEEDIRVQEEFVTEHLSRLKINLSLIPKLSVYLDS